MDENERAEARRRFVAAGPPIEWAVVDADGTIPLLPEAPLGAFRTRDAAEQAAAGRRGASVEPVHVVTTLLDERPALIPATPPWERAGEP